MEFTVTNERLNRLLLSLGFEPGAVMPSRHRQWHHPRSGCTLQLPTNKLQESPRPADLVGIQAQLDLHGHLDASDFELFMTGDIALSLR